MNEWINIRMWLKAQGGRADFELQSYKPCDLTIWPKEYPPWLSEQGAWLRWQDCELPHVEYLTN